MATLFPGHAELGEKKHRVLAVAKAGLEPFTPCVPLTLAMLAPYEMQCLVSGPGKRDTRVLSGTDLPAIGMGASVARSFGSWITTPHRSATMSTEAQRKEPFVIVVMGVSGSGKSTITAMLAVRLGWAYVDADWFHPRVNVEKMRLGKPLTDEDRWPWLRAIAAWIDHTRQAGTHGVVACSALKRAYRDILIRDRPDEDENPITIPIDAQPHEIVQEIIAKLRIATIPCLARDAFWSSQTG
jgi:gluconate kinase